MKKTNFFLILFVLAVLWVVSTYTMVQYKISPFWRGFAESGFIACPILVGVMFVISRDTWR